MEFILKVTETRISRSSEPCTYHSSWPASLTLMSSCSLLYALFCTLLYSLLPTDWVPASIILSGTLCYSTRELHKAILAALRIESSLLCSLLALLSCCCGYGHGHGDPASRLWVPTVLCADIGNLFSWAFPRFNKRLTIWRNLASCNPHLGKDLWLHGYSWRFLNAMFLLFFSVGKTILVAFLSQRMCDFLG